MRLRYVPATALIFLSIFCRADNLTAPDNFYIGNRLPFGQNGNLVYQQVYSSSFFAGPVDITALSFSSLRMQVRIPVLQMVSTTSGSQQQQSLSAVWTATTCFQT